MTKRLKLDEVIDLLNRDDEDFGIANADADFDVASTTDDEVEPIMYDAEPMAAGSDEEYEEIGIEVEVEDVDVGEDGLDLEFVQEEIEERDTASASRC